MAADRSMSEQLSETSAMNTLLEACRDGDLSAVIDILSTTEIDTFNDSLPNGDTVMHVAATSGHVEIVHYLHSQGFALDSKNQKQETPLHYAVRYGHRDVVETLVQQQVDADAQNSRGWTPLHVACYHRQEEIADLLLDLGCKSDVIDLSNETALHIACRENLVDVVKTLLTYSGDIEHENQAGMTPLLLAARFSDAEVVRGLLLAGADIGHCTEQGVKAHDIAVANGRMEVAELLNKLDATITGDRRKACVKQLMPTTRQLDCVRVNVFGASGVGKTQLIESLQVTVMQNLWRRGSALLSAVAGGGERSAPGEGGQISDPNQCTAGKRNSHKTQRISLYQAPCHLHYTRGINTTQCSITGADELCFWELSGYESYYTTYDTNFVGDPNAVYVVVVSLLDSPAERRSQIQFWLNFIRGRMASFEPVGFGGCKFWAPRVLLVGTNADNRYKLASGESLKEDDDDRLVEELTKMFEADLVIEPHLFTVDSNDPMSFEMKTLRKAIGVIKKFICEYLPTEVGLLDPTIATLEEWCRILSGFPVVTWTSFVEYIRSRVNLLATDDHLRELVNQLVVIGAIVDIKALGEELIVLDPQWLGTTVIGTLLAYDTVIHTQPNGLLRITDLIAQFPRIQPADLVRLLTALDLATSCNTAVRSSALRVGNTATTTPPCDADLAVPCLDRSEGPPNETSLDYPTALNVGSMSGSADKKTVIGGFLIDPEFADQLVHVFPHIVSNVLRYVLTSKTNRGAGPAEPAVPRPGSGGHGSDRVDESLDVEETDMRASATVGSHQTVHWSRGVRIVRDQTMYAELRLTEDGRSMTIVCWGPDDRGCDLFFFQETLCEMAFNAVGNCCPGMYVERAPLSVRHLETGVSPPHAYRPREILLAQFAGASNVQAATVDKRELLVDLVAFGDNGTFSRLRPGLDQPVSELPLNVRYRLATLLDPTHPKGRDVNALAESLGLPLPSDEKTNADDDALSPMDALLTTWVNQSVSSKSQAVPTIRDLHHKLVGLDRPDVIEVLLSLTPVYRYVNH